MTREVYTPFFYITKCAYSKLYFVASFCPFSTFPTPRRMDELVHSHKTKRRYNYERGTHGEWRWS